MSDLAGKIAAAPPPEPNDVPRASCWPIYGRGDQEDYEAIHALRRDLTWSEVQAHIDKILGVTEPIPNKRFQAHWNRVCWCWPRELRRPS